MYPRQVPQSLIGRSASFVASAKNHVQLLNLLRPLLQLFPGDDFRLPVLAQGERLPVSDLGCQSQDRIVFRLTMNLRQQNVRSLLGEVTGSAHRRQLPRVSQHQNRNTERTKVFSHSLIHHCHFVNDDQIAGPDVRVPIQRKPGLTEPRVLVQYLFLQKGDSSMTYDVVVFKSFCCQSDLQLEQLV